MNQANRFKTWQWCAVVALAMANAVLFAVRVSAEEAFKSYHVGNSLTWDSQVDSFSLRPSHDDEGYHIKSASSLTNMLANPNTYDETNFIYGPFSQGLPDFTWDVVSLQPYVGASSATELESFVTMANLANDDARLLMYATWPDRRAITTSFRDEWYANPPTGGYNDGTEMRHQRAWYEHALAQVRNALPERQVDLIPVGDVWAALDQKFQEGNFPDLAGALDLYRDVRHANNVGRYAAHLTVWSVMHKLNPVAYPEMQNAFWPHSPGDHNNDVTPTAELGLLIRQTVWEVVSNDSLTGAGRLPGDFNEDHQVTLADYTAWRDVLGGQFDRADYELWKQNYAPHKPGDFNRDGQVTLADYTVWRDGRGGKYDQSDYSQWKAAFSPPQPGDFNRDGRVTLADYTTWRDGLGGDFNLGHYQEWKASFASGLQPALALGQAVPEPASGWLLTVLASLVAMARCCRR